MRPPGPAPETQLRPAAQAGLPPLQVPSPAMVAPQLVVLVDGSTQVEPLWH